MNENVHELHRGNEQCPVCNEKQSNYTLINEEFPFGKDGSVILSARVPYYYCDTCDFGWLGEEAEIRMHEAICRHLNKLSPREIRHNRGDLTLAEMARLCGFTEMSIRRWESGAVVQDTSNDRLLRILGIPGGKRIIGLAADQSNLQKFDNVIVSGWNIDPSDEVLQKKASGFAL